MLRRMRWFSLGLAAGVGGSAWAATKIRRARERLTPSNVARTLARGVADSLAAGGRSLTNEAVRD
ncbi:MAG: hypothetical protein OEX97_13865 [Acidimicrobiia bacterium]|nr:hypothetical protein [Acidimicrobiia bacterium]